jgi:hypothetical protein
VRQIGQNVKLISDLVENVAESSAVSVAGLKIGA